MSCRPVRRNRQRPARRHSGQIDGSPEDGDSFYQIIDDDE